MTQRWYLLRGLLALGLTLSALGAHALCARNEPGRLWDYDGTLGGKYRVRMTLVFSGETVQGMYFYASQLRDIALSGRLVDSQQLLLEETDAQGAVTGRFETSFPERDPGDTYGDSPLTCDVIAGEWVSADGKTRLPVYLTARSSISGSLKHRYGAIGVGDDRVVNDGAAAFWRALKKGDQQAVASRIAYPITLHLDGRKRRFKSSAELLPHFAAIFTPEFTARILHAMPRNLFVRDEGAMLGNGEVWFNAAGKVSSLAN